MPQIMSKSKHILMSKFRVNEHTIIGRRDYIKTWTMKDGTKIRIVDMTDKHLKATIELIERIARSRDVWLDLGPGYGVDPAEVSFTYEPLRREQYLRDKECE